MQTGIHHYQKQLPASLHFNLIAPLQRKSKNNEQIKALEGELLIEAIKGSNLVIAFNEHGQQYSTKSMTHFLSNWQKNSDNVALLIGGANGLSKSVKKHCQLFYPVLQ